MFILLIMNRTVNVWLRVAIFFLLRMLRQETNSLKFISFVEGSVQFEKGIFYNGPISKNCLVCPK